MPKQRGRAASGSTVVIGSTADSFAAPVACCCCGNWLELLEDEDEDEDEGVETKDGVG